jgi:hypothetical protein
MDLDKSDSNIPEKSKFWREDMIREKNEKYEFRFRQFICEIANSQVF